MVNHLLMGTGMRNDVYVCVICEWGQACMI